ncbi:MAG: hypothetical protein WCJ92_05545 [Alphaproteobacteria bacterium]
MLAKAKNLNAFSEIFLISLAIFCQCFSYVDWYFIKSIFDVVDTKQTHLVIDVFLPFWLVVHSGGKLAGAYFLGKLLQQNYFKIMHSITLIFLVAVVLISIVLFKGQSFYSSYQMLYSLCFLTSMPFYALPIISALYLFDRRPSSQHILIGTSIIFALFSSRFVFRFFMNVMPSEQTQIGCVLATFVTCLAFLIYAYVEKHSAPSESKRINKRPFSFPQKINCIFIALGWNLGCYYNCHFLGPFMKNIYVVDCYMFAGFTVCYLAKLLFLVPAAALCKKFGVLKVLTVSLYSMLAVGLLIPFIELTKNSFSFMLALLGFCSACTFVPILIIMYQYYQNTKNLFATLFWFAFGATVSTLIFGLAAHFTKLLNFTFGGMFVFVACILLCLIGAHKSQYVLQKGKLKF